MIADDGVDDDGDSVRSLQRYTGNLLQTRLRRASSAGVKLYVSTNRSNT